MQGIGFSSGQFLDGNKMEFEGLEGCNMDWEAIKEDLIVISVLIFLFFVIPSIVAWGLINYGGKFLIGVMNVAIVLWTAYLFIYNPLGR